jgi:hypothetical protein
VPNLATTKPCCLGSQYASLSSQRTEPHDLDDLRAAMTTAYDHLRPGGVALLCPDHLRDTFAPMTDHGGHDEGARGLRYLEWTWDPDPSDTTYTIDFAYLLRDGTDVRAVHDRHVCGCSPARNGAGHWLTPASGPTRSIQDPTASRCSPLAARPDVPGQRPRRGEARHSDG